MKTIKTKIIFLLLVGFLSISCNKDEGENCQEKIDKINAYYAEQIILAGDSELKIRLLTEERDANLRKACD